MVTGTHEGIAALPPSQSSTVPRGTDRALASSPADNDHAAIAARSSCGESALPPCGGAFPPFDRKASTPASSTSSISSIVNGVETDYKPAPAGIWLRVFRDSGPSDIVAHVRQALPHAVRNCLRAQEKAPAAQRGMNAAGKRGSLAKRRRTVPHADLISVQSRSRLRCAADGSAGGHTPRA